MIVGGGAAGFFAAIACREANPGVRVTLLEGTGKVLSKVRISGGGRCNVTHDQPDPALLIAGYPRGSRVLRGPFTRFGPRETVAWFEARGVKLKTEPDGRMFPETDDSETVISCLTRAATEAGVVVRTRAAVIGIEAAPVGFTVRLRDGSGVRADRVLLATGGAPAGYRMAAALGHNIEPPVPSLFTFELADPRLEGLAGVSVPVARIKLDGARDVHEGPLLITHWGLSGPAVLRASAWGARLLHGSDYRHGFTVDYRPELTEQEVGAALREAKATGAKRAIVTSGPFDLPQRLWRSLATAAGAGESTRWADASNALLAALTREVHAGRYQMTGKGVFKEEFVTCGGVSLKEVDFTTMESRVRPGLYLAGEVLDMDGVTGGFNFQAAWTTGWLAGQAMAQ